MPVYAYAFTAAAGRLNEWRVTVEGETVAYVSFSFPPGPSNLLRVAIFYGEKKVWPWGEAEWFTGDNVTIGFADDWVLPESPCVLRVLADASACLYPHTFTVWLRTERLKPEAMLKYRVTQDGFVEVVV